MDNQELQSLKNKYDIVGNDSGLNTALETAVVVAPTDLTVLITGESGVGKEVIPKIIHQHSRRKNNKYFAVNCGAIPQGTIDSELFGHEKGSFTGAIETRKGYFEEANGGTLFLDEVGELPKETQAKLLRVLQNGEFIKVGSSKVQKTDVRVVAATNVNLLHAVGKGDFREDLYYRLNAIQITMPALRDRKSDIYLLFRKFASDFSEKYGVTKVSLAHDAIAMLRGYRWPGNIRQLKNFTEKVSALESQKLGVASKRCEIDASVLEKYMPKDVGETLPSEMVINNSDSMSSTEKQMLFKAIFDLKNDIEKIKRDLYGPGGPGSSRENYQHPRYLEGGINIPQIGDGRERSIAHQAPQTPPASQHIWNSENREMLEPEDQEFVSEAIEQPVNQTTDDTSDTSSNEPKDLSFETVGKKLIKKALERHDGNRKKAAEDLGISERTLYRKLPEEYKNRNKKN